MYHNIYKDKKINAYDASEEDLKKHIAILKQYGFESVTLEDLYDFVKLNKKIPERSVIFTFDDGFKSVVNASNILKENGYSGVASLIVGYIGSSWEVNDSEINELIKIISKFPFIHTNCIIVTQSFLQIKITKESKMT